MQGWGRCARCVLRARGGEPQLNLEVLRLHPGAPYHSGQIKRHMRATQSSGAAWRVCWPQRLSIAAGAPSISSSADSGGSLSSARVAINVQVTSGTAILTWTA